MKKLITELYSLQDIEYRNFNSKIIPNVDIDKMIGIRIPELRKIAKEMVKTGEYKDFIKELPHTYYEENTLHSCILSLIKDIDELIWEIDKFLPYIDNWATTDALSPKVFKKYPDRILDKVKEWINKKDEYAVRFGVVTLLNFYLDDNFSEEINDLVSSINRDEYYINLAIAWYFSYALIYQYDKTIYIFEEKKLSPWIHNKAIQKAIESFRINNDIKEYLKTLKIK